MHSSLPYSLFLPLLAAAPAWSAPEPYDPWQICRNPAAQEDVAEQTPTAAPDGTTDVTADRAALDKTGISILSGNVLIEQDTTSVHSERVEYDSRTEQVTSPGALMYRDREVEIDASSASVNLLDDTGVFDSASFHLPQEHARGTAERILLQEESETLLEGVTYTTCNPGDEDWVLQAGRLRLDHDEGLGYGRNVLLKFMYVPLFYTPWISFPIDDRRRTGLLPPTIGNTALSGRELQIPFYWNIAPNYDATIAPRSMSKRGTQFQNEFRYLTASSQGSLQADYLPDDRIFGADREFYRLRHTTQLPASFNLSADIRHISDDNYLEDLGDDLVAISQTQQPRTVSLTQRQSWYDFRATAQTFQVTDPDRPLTGFPYYRLPQVSFNAQHFDDDLNLDYSLHSEAVKFQQDERVSGLRSNVKPAISATLGTPGYFLKPTLAYQHTQYRLEQPDGTSLDLDRGAAIVSLDSGLFLERDTGGGLLHTLEPRLYYLYVPFRDQTAIPRFDTSIRQLSFSQLFVDNRFVGADRLGDANQLSVALTSRLLDPASGRELLSGSIGQIRYFDDRRVQLTPTTAPETAETSGFIAEASFTPSPRWALTGTAEWNPDNSEFEHGNLQLQFRPGDQSVYNLGYRFREGDFEQADVSFAWPVTRRLKLVGRWYYSLLDDTPLETFAGLEYESCCWIARLVTRRFIFNRDGDTTNTLLLQIELKGLGSVGRKTDDFLQQRIRGYGLPDYANDY